MFIGILVAVGVVGLVIGSFAGAQVWRLRARQLADDKAAGQPYDTAEYKRLKPLTARKTTEDRSQCLRCGHTLAGYDMIPLFSWLSTKGRCRYCKQPIGRFEPIMELGTAAAFVIFTWQWVMSFGTTPVALTVLFLWLVALTMLIILFAYDLRWFLLPDKIVFPLIGVAAIIQAVLFITVYRFGADSLAVAGSIFASIAILAGLYLILWLVSKGMWVGFGDVKLGVALGILIADWKLALLTLFLANLIGTIVVLPGLLTKKLSRTTQVPFGPFLILGFFISLVWGAQLIAGYESFTIWLTSVLLML